MVAIANDNRFPSRLRRDRRSYLQTRERGGESFAGIIARLAVIQNPFQLSACSRVRREEMRINLIIVTRVDNQ